MFRPDPAVLTALTIVAFVLWMAGYGFRALQTRGSERSAYRAGFIDGRHDERKARVVTHNSDTTRYEVGRARIQSRGDQRARPRPVKSHRADTDTLIMEQAI